MCQTMVVAKRIWLLIHNDTKFVKSERMVDESAPQKAKSWTESIQFTCYIIKRIGTNACSVKVGPQACINY